MDEQPAAMIAADDKLFVITNSGWIHTFSESPETRKTHHLNPASDDAQAPTPELAELLNRAGDSQGYCVWLGIDDAPTDLDVREANKNEANRR